MTSPNESNDIVNLRTYELVIMATRGDLQEAWRLANEEGIPFQRLSIVAKARQYCGEHVANTLNVQWNALESGQYQPLATITTHKGIDAIRQATQQAGYAFDEDDIFDLADALAGGPHTITDTNQTNKIVTSSSLPVESITARLKNQFSILFDDLKLIECHSILFAKFLPTGTTLEASVIGNKSVFIAKNKGEYLEGKTETDWEVSPHIRKVSIITAEPLMLIDPQRGHVNNLKTEPIDSAVFIDFQGDVREVTLTITVFASEQNSTELFVFFEGKDLIN